MNILFKDEEGNQPVITCRGSGKPSAGLCLELFGPLELFTYKGHQLTAAQDSAGLTNPTPQGKNYEAA